MVTKKELERRKKQREYQLKMLREDLQNLPWHIKNCWDCFKGRFQRYLDTNDPDYLATIILSDCEEMERVTWNLHDLAKTIHNYVKYWQKKDWHEKGGS